MNNLSVGDRVFRRRMMIDEPLRVGIITEVYFSKQNHVGRSDTLYEVKWNDTGLTERGYMDIGLIKE